MGVRSKRLLAGAVAAVALLAAACGGDNGDSNGTTQDDAGGGADPLPVTMTAADFSFDPKNFSGHATHAVALTFVNEDDVEHSFTIDDMDVDIEAAGGAEVTEEFTPEELGKFEYYCRYHPDTMTGTLTIE